MRSLTLVPGLALAGLVLPVALVSAPAQSADRVLTPHTPAFKTVSATFTTTPAGFQEATAVCPAGQKVLAGGFTGVNGDYAIYNRAVKKRTAWRVKGVFSEGSTAYAYCSKTLSVTAKANTVNVPADTESLFQESTSTAKCPKGSVVVAGGWQLRPRETNSPVYTSAPVGKKKWTVVAIVDTVDPWKLKTFAYCLDLELDRDLNVATQAVPAPTDSSVDIVATAQCTGGRVIGGGFATTPEPDFNNDAGPDTFFFRSKNDSKKTYTVGATNYSSVAGTVTAYAVCLG